MSAGGDLRQLRALLGAYLRMSLRGKAAATFFRRRPGKWQGTLPLALLYAAIGTVAAIGASGSGSPFSFALVLHTITFVLLGMSQAAESGDVLFRPDEHEVLGHLPFPGRVLLAAKALSLMAYALVVALSINVPAIVVAARLPWMPATFLPGHLVATVVLAAFSTSVIVFAYGLVVRFVDRERLDGLTAWSQAGLSAAFLGLSQGLAHVVELPIVHLDSRFCLVFPPAWFAALDVLATGTTTGRALALALLGVLGTTALATGALTRLAPAYADAVGRLGETRTLGPRARGGHGIVERLVGPWLRDPVERAGFRLAATYMRRDREVRTRLYPSVGFVLLLPFAQLLGHATYRFRAAALLAVLLTGMVPSIVLEAMRVSAEHLASEVFLAAPLRSAGPLFHGVRKAIVCYVVGPMALVGALWILLVDARLLALAAPSLLALPLLSLLPAAFRDYVPLSVPPAIGRRSAANIAIGVVNSVAGGATIGVAWAAWRVGWLPQLVALEAVVVLLGAHLLARRISARPLCAVG